MKVKNVIGGLLLIGLAVLLVIGDSSWLGWIHNIDFFTVFWAVLFVYAVVKRSFWTAVVFFAIVATDLNDSFHILTVNNLTLVIAIFLIAAGIAMIFNVQGKNDSGIREKYDVDASDVDIFNIFGTTTRYLHTKDIDMMSLFGTTKLYVNINDDLTTDYVDVDMLNAFGTTILYIPQSWNIDGDGVVSLFGSDNVYGTKNQTDAPSIRVQGLNLFGSVKIKRI
ncbi:hypothetical protein FC40_GL001317 [Ligilactobacillus hayakitensis DSM 18933 = JCM 14209]|uniref:LiaF transmembrane domain-containing protein n=1 Tax=Ligilactobacillus hayakitensis DSM 18933 = JCM 14209 TaxID=1423755 RepID=A0A0R1WXZ8_9LACO|nr:hypothetical protein [Ligilactobacillus hayakitensis]KRM19798.1 hypothetical protein FC40_GL001317 [Ligilactobacillus hayakitensis DSM 18933 = JCM 14209]